MKTFYEFFDHKKLESSIIEAANLMVEMDIDPPTFILEYVSKDPEIEEKLLRHIELQEGLFGNLAQGVKQFASNIWSGGGIKGGWDQAKDTVVGPLVKFNNAVKSLTALVKAMQDNDQTKNMTATDGKTNLAEYIGKILMYLKKQQDMIPRMQSPKDTQPKMGQAQAQPQQAQTQATQVQPQQAQAQQKPRFRAEDGKLVPL
jgi:hypothetical protein